MIYDMHAHLWDGQYDKNKKQIMTICENYNVSKIFISSLKDGVERPTEEDITRLNNATWQFMREEPSTIRGWCYVNPANKNALSVLRHGIEDCGMSGMKLWIATFCDDPLVFPLAEYCAEHQVPILIHTFYKVVGQLKYESLGTNVANLARRYPELKILMAHYGASCLREIKPIVPYKNVRVDTSGSIYHRDDIDYLKKMIGVKRIIFGTDMPLISYLLVYGQIMEADLTQEEREAVFSGNAKCLLERS
jgi:hypothetical protein